ncbi:MAG: transcriptional regulator [Clostridiales bacterium]|nr:transcriptional regulator [Clostridiales bacterium]
MPAFDYKKAYKDLYEPKAAPAIIDVPAISFIAVRGEGDPNEEGGAYQNAVELLYGVAYTLKMSEKAGYKIDGYFDYVVPPLEGFWWQPGVKGVDLTHKESFHWISAIRTPDFVTEGDVKWAVETASKKKKRDFSAVEFLTITEGLCVQCLHVGPYDSEPETVAAMHRFIDEMGYETDFSDTRFHHEIYLSDPRKVSPEKLKTVIRHPIKNRYAALRKA